MQDDTALNPQSSYGAEKAIAELLLCDYARRGFVDGRVLRLPTISVRPGRPNAAASSFASGIIREPLNGEESVCPVPGSTRLWLLSPRGAIEALVAGCEIDGAKLGNKRVINLPGLSVSVDEMIAALREVAGDDVVKLIRHVPDERVEKIVGSWPSRWDTSRAEALGEGRYVVRGRDPQPSRRRTALSPARPAARDAGAARSHQRGRADSPMGNGGFCVARGRFAEPAAHCHASRPGR